MKMIFLLSTVLRQSYTGFFAYARYKIQSAAWIGFFVIPAFYFIWKVTSPQQYDNLLLRIAAAIMCLVLALRQWWPKPLHVYEMPVAYLTCWFCIPVFVTFMTLMNGASLVWQLTCLASILYLVFLYDTPNVFVATATGIPVGVAGFLIFGSQVVWAPDTLPFMLVLLFAMPSVIFLSYGEDLITEEKVKTASQMAAHVAHEIRTPLASIRMEAERLEQALHDSESAFGGFGPQTSTPLKTAKIENSLKRISEQARSANTVIDTILTNFGEHADQREGLHLSIARTVTIALNGYQFRQGQRELVHLDLEDDFMFRGSDTLIQHVISNLLKNALRAVAKNDGGKINIRLEQGARVNRLVFNDTGTGIPESALPFIFVPFFTMERQETGTGVGLSFCKKIVQRMGGTITCTSLEGGGTTFTIELPTIGST